MATDTPNTPHRVAVYATPDAESSWWTKGSEWLGRCALQPKPMPQPAIDGLDGAALARLTAEPRRYGWHATLKAPFRLAEGVSLATLEAAVSDLARQYTPLTLTGLRVGRMGRFLALRPEPPLPTLLTLAASCVTQLQRLSAPLTPEDIERRRRTGLTPEQDALMLAWGYPWVLDQFRFHFSLTGPLNGVSEQAVERLQSAATNHFAGLHAMPLNCLSIFVEPSPGADFVLWRQRRLGS